MLPVDGRQHAPSSTLISPTAMSDRLRVLMLEERDADADLVRATLAREGITTDVVRAESPTAFTAELHTPCPDVVLCRNGLPGFTIFDAVEAVRTSCPGTPVFVVSDGRNHQQVATLIRAGVEDVVPKDDLPRLGAAVQEAIRIRRQFARLSPRQRLILRHIAEGQTTPEIARELGLSEKTVGTHRVELMRRLAIHGVAELVRYAVRVGVVPVDWIDIED